MRKLLIILGVGLFVSGALWAADFWTAKPYTEWSTKDIQKMMSNSPWAHLMPVSMGSSRGGGGGKLESAYAACAAFAGR